MLDGRRVYGASHEVAAAAARSSAVSPFLTFSHLHSPVLTCDNARRNGRADTIMRHRDPEITARVRGTDRAAWRRKIARDSWPECRRVARSVEGINACRALCRHGHTLVSAESEQQIKAKFHYAS